MADLIERQAAIDIIEGIETERLKGNVELIYAPAIKGLRALPSAHPDLQPTCNQVATDCISRKAAIDALAKMMPKSYTPDGSHPADEEIFREQEIFADCIKTLEILPSAQPEPRWIPCSERLPEENGTYLVCYEDVTVPIDWFNGKWFFYHTNPAIEETGTIIAWSELPEPWRGEET